jgi:hypothetical protein
MLKHGIFGLPFVDAIEAGAGTSRSPSHSIPAPSRPEFRLSRLRREKSAEQTH